MGYCLCVNTFLVIKVTCDVNYEKNVRSKTVINSDSILLLNSISGFNEENMEVTRAIHARPETLFKMKINLVSLQVIIIWISPFWKISTKIENKITKLAVMQKKDQHKRNSNPKIKD